MKTTFVLAAFGVLLASSSYAQPSEDRVRLSFNLGVMAGAIDGGLGIGGSAGYRFTDHFAFEVEFTASDEPADRFSNRVFSWADGIEVGPARIGDLVGGRGGLNLGRVIPIGFPIPIEGTSGGSTQLMTAGFRYEFPVQNARIRPYLSGGFGVSRTAESFNITLASNTTTSRSGTISPGGVITVPGPGGVTTTVTATSLSSILPEIDDSFSHTGIMASAGVGASLRIYKGVWADLNARYYRLDRDRNLGSFGGGVSYRF